MLLNMHSLNNEGGEGNQIITRQATILDCQDERHTVTAISGDMFKHIHATHMVNYCKENGLPLSDYSKVVDPNRISANELSRKIGNKEKVKQEEVMDEIIKTCSVCDAHGLLITEDVKGNKNTPRHSVVEFAWTVGIPGKNGTETYIHSKLVSDSGAKGSATESNEGQNLFHRPANYGEYAFICNIEVYRIGLNDINRTYPIDDNDREKRYQAILVSLISSMLNPEGAMTSSQKPHVTGFKGVVSWSHKLVPAPTVSALNSDYIKQIENVAENVNNIYKTLNNNETINVVETEEFKNISDFVSIINKLLKDQPYKIHD